MTVEKAPKDPPVPNWLLKNRAYAERDKRRILIAENICNRFPGVTLGHLVEPGDNKDAQRARLIAIHAFAITPELVKDEVELMDLFQCTRSEIEEAMAFASSEKGSPGTAGEIASVKTSEQKRDRSNEQFSRDEIEKAVTSVSNVSLDTITSIPKGSTGRSDELIARHVLMYLLYKLANLNIGEIGAAVGLNRYASSTTSHSIRHMDEILARRGKLSDGGERKARDYALKACEILQVRPEILMRRRGPR